jgi:hypothetical protein
LQLQIESTDQLTTFNGVPVRVWKGVTASGVECLVFVHRIAVHDSADSTQFEAELKEQLPPGRHIPLSAIL